MKRFCTVNPICHVNPHHATKTAKMQHRALEMTITAMAWPTDSPWVRNVFGVCHVATLREDLKDIVISGIGHYASVS